MLTANFSAVANGRFWLKLNRIFADHRVLHLEGRREEAQVHLSQRHRASQPFLQLCLNPVVILVYVNHVRHNQRCRNHQYNDHQNCNSEFSHKSPRIKTGCRAYTVFTYLDDKAVGNEDLLSSEAVLSAAVAP